MSAIDALIIGLSVFVFLMFLVSVALTFLLPRAEHGDEPTRDDLVAAFEAAAMDTAHAYDEVRRLQKLVERVEGGGAFEDWELEHAEKPKIHVPRTPKEKEYDKQLSVKNFMKIPRRTPVVQRTWDGSASRLESEWRETWGP